MIIFGHVHVNPVWKETSDIVFDSAIIWQITNTSVIICDLSLQLL